MYPRRRNACYVVWYGSKTACALLHHACLMISALLRIRRGAPDTHCADALAARVLAAMAEAGFMSAVCDAVNATVSTAALLRSDIGKRELLGPTFDVTALSTRSDGQAGLTALTVCQYMLTVTEAQFHRLVDVGGGRNPQGSSRLPSEVLQVCGALVDSQLLAAAATALVDSPPVDEIATLPEEVRNSIRFGVRYASSSAATALFYMFGMQTMLAKSGAPEGQRLSAGLLRAARHEAVQRLQVGLLDQLAAHAGMAAGLEEWEGSSGPQEGRDEERRAEECGWEGSSGTWWLAREEAAQGQLLGLDRYGGDGSSGPGRQIRSKTAGWLEEYHCHIVRVTVLDWLSADPEEAAAAGVPAAPPPLLRARLTARAAEALCRLGRGQGLGGAYAPAPEWQFAMSQVRTATRASKEDALKWR